MIYHARFSLAAMAAVVLGLLLMGGNAGAIEGAAPRLPIDSDLPVQYGTEGIIMNEVIVQFGSAADARTAQSLSLLPGVVWERTMRYRPVSRFRIIDGSTPFEAISRLRHFPGVVEVYPNYRRSVAMQPNDPYFGMQQEEIRVARIPDAWDIETGSNDVLVAVIDTGVDTQHPDLLPNLVLPGVNVREDDYPDIVTDDSGHGTAVAGIIGAVGNNGVGIAGVSWHVRILPIRAAGGQFLDCDLFDEVDAIDVARERGADIINLSIGGIGTISVEEQAVKQAHDAGIVIVAAAGNANPGKLYKATGNPQTDRQYLYYPAGLPEVIGVGAVDNTGAKAEFSNYGEDILEVMAPGVDIVTTVPDYEVYLYTGEGPPYGLASGTSFATPMVSGVVALMLSHYPDLSPDAVLARIQTSAIPMAGPDENGNGVNDYYGYGILNAVGALSATYSGGNSYMQVGVCMNPLIPGEILVIVRTFATFDAPPMVNWSMKGTGQGASFQLNPVASRPGVYIGSFGPEGTGNITISVSGFVGGAPVPRVSVVYSL